MNWDELVTLNNRGTVALRQGKHEAAVSYLAKAADASPAWSPCRSNFLLSLLYHPQFSPRQVAEAHRRILDERVAARPPARPPERRLRIAYLTPDFHFHPKAFLHIPHLRHYDSERFELFVYSTAPADDYTRVAREAAAHWREVSRKSPEEIARLIRRDAIDVLIDITGHFGGSPLAVFAMRPAPLQVSIAGYPATTGLRAMDYKIVDRWTDPAGQTEDLYVERLIRLRRPIVCYAPPGHLPEPGELPARSNGFITFGSFNNRPKLNPRLIALWAEILRRAPGSRLLLHHTFGGYAKVSREYRDPMVRLFRDCGISSRRLEFVGALPVSEHLRTITEADIALDSFPYHGVTTSCECLWMGVPVLSMAGRAHVSRVGVSILTNVGFGDWVANSPDEYIRLAVDRAKRPDELDRLRQSIREAMRRSPLTDGPGYIRAIEGALLVAWKRLSNEPKSGSSAGT